jgi:hypothetical protein
MAIKIKKVTEKSKPAPKNTLPKPENSKAKSKRGGKRPGAGRKAGTPNRASSKQKLNLSFVARQHTDTAIDTLVTVCNGAEYPAAARVTAANSLLDRGYGRPTQSHELSGKDGGPIPTVDLTNATEEQLDALEAFFGKVATSVSDDDGDPDGEGEAED